MRELTAASKERSFPLEGIALLIVAVVLWQAASTYGFISPTALPAPLDVGSAAWREAVSGSLLENLNASLRRYAIGYFIGAILGISLGILIGTSSLLEELSRVPLNSTRQIPGLAWIPVAILWFGIGDMTSIFVIVLGAFFPTVMYTHAGVKNVDRVLLRAALTLGARPNSAFLFRKVILPGALPQIMIGLRIAVAFSWSSIVAAEMVGSQSGMGYLIQFYRMQYRIDRILFYMFAIGALGYLFDLLIRLAQQKLLAWQAGLKAR